MRDGEVRISGAGICCLDHIFCSPRPDWGDTALVTDYQIQGGGLVATALVACARLGARCDLFSLLGDDATAAAILKELIEEKVDVSGVRRVAGGASPVSFIHVEEGSGDRTIFHRSGAALAGAGRQADLSAIGASHALLVDDIYPDLAAEAARCARDNGVPVIADLIPEPRNHALLQHVDVLIAPRYYARQIGCESDIGSALSAINELGPATAVITLGADGLRFSDGAREGYVGAFDVDVVDTTGAGDTFHGAFAYGVARGWDTERCGEFAAAVAAIKCTMPGGRTGLPTLQKALEFLRSRGRLDWAAIS